MKINRLQTETEKSEQRGMESILRGMYQAIRNPRSHEQIEDTQDTADAIIFFINFLLGIIEKSEEPFVMSKFMTRVFDPDFYKSQQYAELLVNEIPTNKRFDALITIYRQKCDGEIYAMGLVVSTLLGRLPEDQVKQYIAIVADELSTVTDEKTIRYNLHLLPPALWSQLSDLSRLRIENRLIRAISEGEVIGTSIKKGALATWARNHFQHFSLKDQVGIAFLTKLESNSASSRRYVAEHFLLQLPVVILHSFRVKRCVRAISDRIREGEDAMQRSLLENMLSLPDEWQEKFVEALKDMTDEERPAIYLNDGRPFLKESADLGPEDYDDVPF